MADGYRESADPWADLLRDSRRRGMRAPSWRSATEPSASGRPSPRCSPRPGIKGAGFTRPRMSWTRFRSRPSRARRRPCRKSTTPRITSTRSRRSRRSRSPTARGSPRPSRRSPMRSTSCWPSTTSPPNTGFTCAPTNPIESTFATVRPRTKVTKGAGSAAAALAMVFKLVESAQARWRAVNAAHLVALVRAETRFERGTHVERPEGIAVRGGQDRPVLSWVWPGPSARVNCARA